jgi:hypothetical protein
MRLARGISVTNTSKSIGIAYDADAQAFITASGISGTEANAINTLVVNLKTANIWTKMKAVYPMVGGTATSCKFNLKDARDLDAAYRLLFSGGGTFSANGYQPNGTNACANTSIVPSSVLNQNSIHLSYYSRTNNGGLYDIGHSWTGETSLIYLLARYSDGKSYFRLNAQPIGGTESSQTIADSLGLFTINRTSSSIQSLIKNSTKYTFNVNSFSLPINDIYLALISVAPTNYFGSRECAFSSIGDGLTDAEALAFYNAVQTFQTTLGRQV